MDGLNGEIVYKVENAYAGTVDGAPYGYRRPLRVTVSVRVERLTRREEYETTEHRLVSKPLDFAITTDVWRPDGHDITAGGAGADTLRNLVGYADGFTADQAAQLVKLAGWHLNAMTAGCAHQVPVMETDGYGREVPSLTKTPKCRVPDAIDLHPGEPEKDGKPATAGGYRYGSAWLVRELPAGFLGQLRAAMPPADGVYTEPEIPGAPPTLKQRMRQDGLTGKVRHTRTRDDGTRLWSARYTLAGRVLSVPFFTGAGIKDAPTADEILSTAIGEALDYENAGSLDGFVSEFGGDPEDPATRRTYHTLSIQQHKLEEFLRGDYRAYLDETER